MTEVIDPLTPITVEESDDSDYGGSIRELRAPANERMLARLQERLVESLGLSADAGAAIARAVNDPSSIRRRIGATASGDSPGLIRLRVPDGELTAVPAEVNALAVAAWLMNPRQASRLRYPVEEQPGQSEASRFLPLTSIASQPSHDELVLDVESHEHAVWAYDRMTEYLRDLNDLAPRIAKESVISPVVLVPTRITPENGDSFVTILTSVDGSSRVTAAQRILGVSGQDVLYRFPTDRRLLNDRIARVRQVYGRSETEVTEEEVARARVLNLPAFIIVGFTPEEQRSSNFSAAIREYVGLTHVDPPKPWDEAGTLDTYADSVLDTLLEYGKISDAEFDYFAGMIPVSDLKDRGFELHLDTRAARLVQLVTRPLGPVYKLTGQAIRQVSQKGQARQRIRLDVFCELVLRSMRTSRLGSGSITGVRSALQRTYSMPELVSKEWSTTKSTPEELCDAALEELQGGGPGGAARELAVRGAYWLVGYGVLAREPAGQRAQERADNRAPSTLLRVLHSNEHGIYILRQAILDGREGTPPRIVDGEGNVLLDASSTKDAIMSADWLRRIFPPGPVEGDDDVDGEAPIESPIIALNQKRSVVTSATSRLRTAVNDLRSVRGAANESLIDQEGFPPKEVNEIRTRLREVDDQLMMWRLVHEQRYPPVLASEDSDEAEGD
jgi:hypothetical protein